MRLILLGVFLHWRNQLAVVGKLVWSQMVQKQDYVIQPIEHYDGPV